MPQEFRDRKCTFCHGTNEYNFEKLENPPTFKPTYCGGCGRVIHLGTDGFMMSRRQVTIASVAATSECGALWLQSALRARNNVGAASCRPCRTAQSQHRAGRPCPYDSRVSQLTPLPLPY